MECAKRCWKIGIVMENSVLEQAHLQMATVKPNQFEKSTAEQKYFLQVDPVTVSFSRRAREDIGRMTRGATIKTSRGQGVSQSQSSSTATATIQMLSNKPCCCCDAVAIKNLAQQLDGRDCWSRRFGMTGKGG